MRFLDYLLAFLAPVGLGLTAYWGMFLSPSNPAGLEQRLQTKTSAALKAQGHDWAEVRMEGQRAVISGAAPSRDALQDAAETVLTADGAGGLIFGGVTVIESAAAAAPPISPYVWRATKTDSGKIILSGHVPSATIQSAIRADAEALAPGAVDDRTEIGSGAGEGNWQGVARLGLRGLGFLDVGEARLTDQTLALSGVSMDDTVRAQVSADIANIAAPFSGQPDIKGASLWSATHGEGALILSGKVASESERAEILSIAQSYYQREVRDEMTVTEQDYEGWMDGVRAGLPHFAKFESGEMGFEPEGDGFAFRGEASGSTLEYLRQDMAQLTGPYGVNIVAEAVVVEVAEIEGIDFSADPVTACQTAFDNVLETNKVYFASGKADITRQSGETLDKLMAVSAQCDETLIFELGGHTDNSGGRDQNVSLSQLRAAAVADYMSAAGFDAARLQAKGYGPDTPVADNTTPEGRAKNRRIEFRVLERSE